MISSRRSLRRAVAVVSSLAIVALEPALADDAPPEETAESELPGTAAAEPMAEPAVNPWADYAAKAFDVFPIRVLSSSAVVVGFGAFLASVPLVGPGGQLEAIRASWDYFVIGPVDYTFVRPLGDF